MAAQLLRMIDDLQESSSVTAFGTFPTGHQLATGFTNKAVQAAGHIREHAAIATRMAENFRAIEARYAAQDDANADSLASQAGSPPLVGGK